MNSGEELLNLFDNRCRITLTAGCRSHVFMDFFGGLDGFFDSLQLSLDFPNFESTHSECADLLLLQRINEAFEAEWAA